ETVRRVAERDPVLEGADARLERKSLRPAEHVVSGDFEDSARARADRGPAGIFRATGDALHLESEPIADRIALPFQRLDHHGFVRVGAIWILRRDLDAVENTKVVELPLGFC